MPEYDEPIVLISTKKLNDKVEITVKDNGNGILKKIVDKNLSTILYNKTNWAGNGIGIEFKL